MDSSRTPFKEKRQLLENHLEMVLHHYKSIRAGNSDIICAIDLDGYFILPNPAFEKISGYTAKEISQLSLATLVNPEDLDKAIHNFHLSLEGNLQNYDCSITHKNGKRVDLNFTLFPVLVDNEILGVYGVAKDITELKLNRLKVKENEVIYQLLTDNSLDMITRTDLEGNYLYISPACHHILGFTPDELVGKSFPSLIHIDDLEKAKKNQIQVINSKKNGCDTYRFQRKDGNYIWVEALCKPLIDPKSKHVMEIISVIRDISDRKKAEEESQNSSARFQNLVEYSPDAIIIVKDFKILYINDTGVELFGAIHKEGILNKNIFDFLHEEYINVFQDWIKQVNNGEPADFIDQKFTRLDGSILEAEVMGIPTIFRNETANHLIVRDTSKRKQTQQLLLQSEKLTVAGQLAAGIAHEIRNPLTAIKGFLQLIETRLTEEETYFDIITSEMDRIELILTELLTLAKPQDMKFAKSDIKHILETVKTLIDTQALMNNIEIITLYDSDISTIYCDVNQLKQVFINFVKNSIEAMSDGGKITIEVRKHGCDKIKLLFVDQGSGIPKHLLKRVGEPFFTTKEKGTGLGLMVSKQIIENHNGSIHVWSDKEGTIIEVILPIQ